MLSQQFNYVMCQNLCNLLTTIRFIQIKTIIAGRMNRRVNRKTDIQTMDILRVV